MGAYFALLSIQNGQDTGQVRVRDALQQLERMRRGQWICAR